MSTPNHNPIDAPETHDGFFTPESSPSPSNSEDIDEERGLDISIRDYYQHGDKRIKKKKFILIYHHHQQLVEGFMPSWGGSQYWSVTKHMTESDGVFSMVNKPNDIKAYITMLGEYGSLFNGMKLATNADTSIKRGLFLTPRDWELLKRAKKIEWDNGPSKAWIPSEVTSE